METTIKEVPSSQDTNFILEYGDILLKNYLPEDVDIKILRPTIIQPQFDDLEKQFQKMLEHPIGMEMTFSEFVTTHFSGDKDVLIVIDDYTRPNRHARKLLPLIENKLLELGVRRDDIKLIIATGTHRSPTESEIKKKILKHLQDQWEDRIIIHDSRDSRTIKNLGYVSSRGTPLTLNTFAVDAAFLIALGDPEYHYFAGIAGNSKLIVPGIAGEVTIRKNHPLIFEYGMGFKPQCRLGNIKDNPMILDVMELVDYIDKNVVPIFSIQAVEQDRQIIWMQAGNIIKVHQESASILQQVREIHVKKPADMVIVGTGNLGINLFQAGKAVHAGWNAVRKDGRGFIVIIAPCTDGVGNMQYEKIMHSVEGMPIPDALNHIIDHFCTEKTFVMGNHKPVDQLRVLKDVDSVYFLTDFDGDELERIYRFKKIPMIKNDPELSLRIFLDRMKKEHDVSLIYILPDPSNLVVVKNQSK